MKYCAHDDRTKDDSFLNYDASGKVVFLTKQSFEYEGQMQVEFLMTHPVYPASAGCDLALRLFPQLWRPDREHSSWSLRG